jgi:hypothetical protein
MIFMVRDVKEQFWKDMCAKLDIPINARVSVFGHCSFPVLNNTTMSFICKWVPVDNCLLLFAPHFVSEKDCLFLLVAMSLCLM